MADAHETDTQALAREGIDTQWLLGLIDSLQGAVSHTLTSHPEIACDALREVGARMLGPRTAAERFALRGLLFEYACRAGARLHQVVHVRSSPPCAFNEHGVVRDCFGPTSRDPRGAFERWTMEFSAALRHVHPERPVEQVARRIQQHYQQPLNAEQLATEAGLTPAGLRRAFRAAYGQSMRDYQGHVRLLMALEAIRSQKVAAVSRQLGYRSPKNFYRALRNATGLTPTAFRALSPTNAQGVINDAWARFRRGRLG